MWAKAHHMWNANAKQGHQIIEHAVLILIGDESTNMRQKIDNIIEKKVLWL